MEPRYYSTEEKDAAVPVLPDPLLQDDGSVIRNASEWELHQRAKILHLFEKYEYGTILSRPDMMRFELLSHRKDALNGTAERKEIRIHCAMNNGKSIAFDLLLYLPLQRNGAVPAFLGLNFKGNHNASPEEDAAITGWMDGAPVEPGRSKQSYRNDFENIIRRGYASATICYHDIHPDVTGHTAESVFRLFFEPEEYGNIGKKHSIIGAWAWGLSRALDCLEHESAIDARRVAVYGHSRLGKTALWAGATDPRFRMVISNDSGCGGAALHKRRYGENLSLHFQWHLDRKMPVWFVDAAEQFVFNEEKMPFDQHELLALIAPRPLAVGNAAEDLVADPRGSFLACCAASRIYALYGAEGVGCGEMPPVGSGCGKEIWYHCRPGDHELLPEDWRWYLDFADRYL